MRDEVYAASRESGLSISEIYRRAVHNYLGPSAKARRFQARKRLLLEMMIEDLKGRLGRMTAGEKNQLPYKRAKFGKIVEKHYGRQEVASGPDDVSGEGAGEGHGRGDGAAVLEEDGLRGHDGGVRALPGEQEGAGEAVRRPAETEGEA